MNFENNLLIQDQVELSLKDIIQKTKEWIAFIKLKYKTILIVSFVGALIGVVVAFFDKPTYKAVLTFTMEEDKGGGGLSGALGLASSLGIDLGGNAGGAFSATNIIELMKSRLIVEKVLLNQVELGNRQRISFAEYYIQINKLREKWKDKPNIKDIRFPINGDRKNFSLQQDSILKQLYKLVTDKKSLSIAQKDKKVTIVTMEVTSENEIFSKLFCENLATEVSKFYIETKSKKAKINLEALQNQVDSVRLSLDNAINGVATETDNVYNLNPSLNYRTTPTKKRQIDVQANTAILTQLVTQLEIAKVGLRKETPLIQLIDKPTLPLDKDKIGKLDSLLLGGFLGCILSLLYLIFGQILRNKLN